MFGVVLAVSVYHFQSHVGCRRPEPARVVRVAPQAVHPCPAMADRPVNRIVVAEAPPSSEAIDMQADVNLQLARAFATKDPKRARALCRETMQLYHNSPRNARVRVAFKLLNTIPQPDEDDSDNEND